MTKQQLHVINDNINRIKKILFKWLYFVDKKSVPVISLYVKALHNS